MLYVPPSIGDFGWQLSSQSGVRPANAYGHSITPGNNVKGAWVEILTAANVARDVSAIQVQINSNGVLSTARAALVDVGVDPAGGSSYTVLIPDLLAHAAGPLAQGLFYWFPLRIKAGSSVAVRASVNTATVGTLRAWVQVFGSPKRPDLVKVGTSVVAYGINAGTSAGTAVTQGAASEGAWTSLGSTSRDHFFWQLGIGADDPTMLAATHFSDLSVGDATNKRIILEDFVSIGGTDEHLENRLAQCWAASKTGDTVYARSQSSGTAQTNWQMAAYGVAG